MLQLSSGCNYNTLNHRKQRKTDSPYLQMRISINFETKSVINEAVKSCIAMLSAPFHFQAVVYL